MFQRTSDGQKMVVLAVWGLSAPAFPTQKPSGALTEKKRRVYNNPYILGTAGWFWRTMWKIQGIHNFGLEDTE
ncbi:hypothetical protein B5F54_02665 [Anaeromassilibacillus sp. An250]|nr:hypothetical protein B5F54_02665 [Anaeromassilibacillus sp. An250]